MRESSNSSLHALPVRAAWARLSDGTLRRHFRRALTEFGAHYHHERNHRGLGNVLIDGDAERKTGRRIRCCPRLGGRLNYYERAA